MDRSNYVVNESNDADAIDIGFTNRSVLISNDVEKVLCESQNNAIEPIHGCDNNSLFLNPINDFLSEINEYGNSFCVDPTLVSPNTHKETKAVNSDWNVHEPVYALTNTSDEFSNMIEMQSFGHNSLQPHVQSPDFGVYSLNESTEQSVLTTDHQHFVSNDYTFLGTEYTSSPNQWFLNLDQQQQHTAYTNVIPLTNICQQESATQSTFNNRNHTNDGNTYNHNYSENLINTIISLPSCTTISPISTAENNCINRPLDLVSNEVVFDATHTSVINNEINNNSTCLLPMSVKSSIHQQDQDSYSSLISTRTDAQPFSKTNLCSTSSNRNIRAENSHSITLSNIQSISNMRCLKNENCLSVVEPVYQSTTLSDQQLHSKGSHHLAFKGLEQTNYLNWTAVFPRTQFIQPPEIIIMHPLRTRKLIPTNRITSSNLGLIGSDAAMKPLTGTIVPLSISSAPPNSLFNMTPDKNDEHVHKSYGKEDIHHGNGSLSEYFDTTSVNIPMIKERSRADSKNENRRKQKLHIIPGAENLIFEVQRNGDSQDNNGDVIQIQTNISEINKAIKSFNVEDPYPETELSELDEIFRRKKKTNNTTAAGSKRTYQISQSISVGSGCDIIQKKYCPNSILEQSETDTTTIKESSHSFDEKTSVSIALCKEKSNLVEDKNDLVNSSESESIDTTDEADNGQSQAGRSFKCKQCKKLLKTTRSLAIHTKRCVNLNPQNVVAVQYLNKSNHNKDKDDDVNGEIYKRKTDSGKLIQSPKSSLNDIQDIQELNVTHYLRSESVITEGNPKTSFINVQPNNKTNPRPITRSQTRRSTGRHIPYSALVKLSK